MLMIVIVLSAIALGILLFSMFRRYKERLVTSQGYFDCFSRPLLVIAHPDDESMFFIPVLVHLMRCNKDLHVLCYTTGNFNGLGAIRREELYKATSSLGIPSKNVTVLDDEGYLDGMKAVWNIEKATNVLKDYIAENEIDCLLTFDNYGVSGHPNHISCFQICSEYFSKYNNQISFMILESVNIVRKYIGILDVFASLFSKDSLFVYYNRISTNVAAMKAHKSQYTTINTLHVIN